MNEAAWISERLRKLEFEVYIDRSNELRCSGSRYYRFTCRDCGDQETMLCKPQDAEGICPTCCGKRDEHEYEYFREDHGWSCIHCGDEPPLDSWIYNPET